MTEGAGGGPTQIVMIRKAEVETSVPQVPYASSAVGGWVHGRRSSHSLDWSIPFEQPVRFMHAMDALADAGIDILLDLRYWTYIVYQGGEVVHSFDMHQWM